jgi:uncharacterized coiled-coil DUF342 family protein
MDEVQMRERITRWIAESKELFAVLPELFEAERFRRELTEMRKEHAELQRKLDELRKQNDQLRAEKDEAAQALAKMLETVQATNQIAQKLGVTTKSPFARRAEAPAAAPNPAAPE